MNPLTLNLAGPVPHAAWGTPGGVTRFLATALLAAVVTAVLLATERWLGGWAESHLVAAWLALWGVAVLAIVLLRGLTRLLAQRLMAHLDAWSAGLARRRADERLWAMARQDPRMLRELEMAIGRDPAPPPECRSLENLQTRRARRLLRDRLYYI